MPFIRKLGFVTAIIMVFAAGASAATSAEVQIKSLGYTPKLLEIRVGQAVVWKNTARTRHSATSDVDSASPVFDTGLVAPGATSKEILFTRAGHYPYHCSIHGKTMGGEIVVKDGAP